MLTQRDESSPAAASQPTPRSPRVRPPSHQPRPRPGHLTRPPPARRDRRAAIPRATRPGPLGLPRGWQAGTTADMTISSDDLVRRNAEFAATGAFAGLPIPASDTLQVLGCVDSRVDLPGGLTSSAAGPGGC